MHPVCPVMPQSPTASKTRAVGAPGLLGLLEGPSPSCSGVGCLTWPRCHAFPLFLLSSADFVQVNASQFVVSEPCRLQGFWMIVFPSFDQWDRIWGRALFPHAKPWLTFLPAVSAPHQTPLCFTNYTWTCSLLWGMTLSHQRPSTVWRVRSAWDGVSPPCSWGSLSLIVHDLEDKPPAHWSQSRANSKAWYTV